MTQGIMFNVLYETINLVNGKRYIGSHMTENVHDSYLGSGSALRRAIKKYGRENFSKRVFGFAANEKNLDLLESIFVTEKEVADKNYYNMVPGGNRPPKSTSESIKKGHTTRIENGNPHPSVFIPRCSCIECKREMLQPNLNVHFDAKHLDTWVEPSGKCSCVECKAELPTYRNLGTHFKHKHSAKTYTRQRCTCTNCRSEMYFEYLSTHYHREHAEMVNA